MRKINFIYLSKVLLLAVLFLFNACQVETETQWTLSSPDGDLQVTVRNQAPSVEETDMPKVLQYRVDRVGEGEPAEILGWSPLGITREDVSFGQDLEFASLSRRSVEDSYTMLRGKQEAITSRGEELTLQFQHPGGAQMELIFRAYDDGVAFRYRFPEESNELRTVTAEQTGFNLPVGGKVWLQPYDEVTKYTPAYERFFENGIPIGQAAPSEEGWAFPALFRVNEHWILLSESDLDGSFFGAHLQPEAPNGLYTIRLPEPEEAMGRGTREATSTLPWQTPWRVAIIGEALSTVVESTLITDLAPANVLEDTSWIEPGRASWSWWSDHPSSRDFEKLKAFVDLAAGMGWEYSLVDANWNTMEGGDIEQLIAYAKEKDIGILMWYNSGGGHNTVEEQPRDRMWDPELREAEFQKLEAWGVRGVKVDFFQSDKPLIINQYLDILEDASEHHLLVNFHGCTIPRGWDRTYPHLLAMESVKGAEAYSFDESYPEMAPSQNTIFALTRNVIGPMDYTPVAFSDNVYPHITTNAHELALAVAFESGILHFADRVEAYLGLPEQVREILENIPVTWKETKLLQGMPGESVLIARRHMDTWYIAGLNGEGEAKSFDLDLSFVGEGNAELLMVKDGTTEREFAISVITHPLNQPLMVEMLPYGGFLIKVNQD